MPVKRRDFERNMNIAIERIRSGKHRFTENTTMLVDSLTKVRDLPNGRLNFLTIDEAARLHANHAAEMSDNYEAIIENAKIKGENTNGNQNAEQSL